MKKRADFWLALVPLCVLSEAALAGSMRCGGHYIADGGRHGPGKYEVLKKCGEPTERFGGTWIYDKGRSRYVLRFNDAGLLVAIDQRSD